MKFNSGNDSLYADALFWSGANSGSFPVDPDFTRCANAALDKIYALILRADNRWQFNDSNLSTELLDTTTNLVSGTQKYAISVTWLSIARVRVKDSAGNWITLKRTDRDQLSDSQLIESGTPWGYFKLGGFIYLVGIPNYASTGGMEVQYRRGPDYFVVGDTTKTPGFASHLHRLVSLYAALDYVEVNVIASRRQPILDRIGQTPSEVNEGSGLLLELAEHYAQRDKDGAPSLSLRREDYGASALGGSAGSNPRGINM